MLLKMEDIPGIERIVRDLVVDQRRTHAFVCQTLQNTYPFVRGLSSRSVRRFCERHNIHRTSRLTDQQIDLYVSRNIDRVGPSYGRRTMTGLLAAEGIRACQLRVGRSLQRMDPANHCRRLRQLHRQTNPIPYRCDYFGEKLHVDQNEKLVLFGATHVCAVDGFTGKIVGLITMPIKNCMFIYEHLYHNITMEYGLWNQIRVDKGREWSLMLFIQETLSQYRNNTRKPSYMQTSSKQNHIVERMWVEVNNRINYPIKSVLVAMLNQGEINMEDPLHQYCVSWFTIKVSASGVSLFVRSWNNHPIPGRRQGGMSSHIPNVLMARNNRIVHLNSQLIPSPRDAQLLYHQAGGNITNDSLFGNDPLAQSEDKKSLRLRAFCEQYPSFDVIFNHLVNSDSSLFHDALLFYITITYRLSLVYDS